MVSRQVQKDAGDYRNQGSHESEHDFDNSTDLDVEDVPSVEHGIDLVQGDRPD